MNKNLIIIVSISLLLSCFFVSSVDWSSPKLNDDFSSVDWSSPKLNDGKIINWKQIESQKKESQKKEKCIKEEWNANFEDFRLGLISKDDMIKYVVSCKW